MLITSAPASAAQTRPAIRSLSQPSFAASSTFTGRMRAAGSTPATCTPLPTFAPNRRATCVPCGWSALGSPSPFTRSIPGRSRPARSGSAGSTPLSRIATTIASLPRERFQAAGAPRSAPGSPPSWPVFSRCHWSGKPGSSGRPSRPGMSGTKPPRPRPSGRTDSISSPAARARAAAPPSPPAGVTSRTSRSAGITRSTRPPVRASSRCRAPASTGPRSRTSSTSRAADACPHAASGGRTTSASAASHPACSARSPTPRPDPTSVSARPRTAAGRYQDHRRRPGAVARHRPAMDGVTSAMYPTRRGWRCEGCRRPGTMGSGPGWPG